MKSNLPEEDNGGDGKKTMCATNPAELIAMFGKLSEHSMTLAVMVFCKSNGLQKEDAVRLLKAVRRMETPECMAFLMAHKKMVGEMCHACLMHMVEAVKSAPFESGCIQAHIDGDEIIEEMVRPMLDCFVMEKDKFIAVANGTAPDSGPEFRQKVESIMKSVALEVIEKCKSNPDIAAASGMMGGPGIEKMKELEAELKKQGVQKPTKELLQSLGIEGRPDDGKSKPPFDPSNN